MHSRFDTTPYVGDDALRRLSDILTVRRAVDTMFGGAAADAGKPAWCEKTPFNVEVRAEDLTANWPGQRRVLFGCQWS